MGSGDDDAGDGGDGGGGGGVYSRDGGSTEDKGGRRGGGGCSGHTPPFPANHPPLFLADTERRWVTLPCVCVAAAPDPT